MAERIQLMSAGFNGWMEETEAKLTNVKDTLSLLESEERRLSGIWESGAREKWSAGFQRELIEIRQLVMRMEGLLQRTQESANTLLHVEKGLMGEAERI